MDWFKKKPTEQEQARFAKLYEKYKSNKLPPRIQIGYHKFNTAPNPEYNEYELLKNKFINKPDFPQYMEKTGGKTRKRRTKRRRTLSSR